MQDLKIKVLKSCENIIKLFINCFKLQLFLLQLNAFIKKWYELTFNKINVFNHVVNEMTMNNVNAF